MKITMQKSMIENIKITDESYIKVADKVKEYMDNGYKFVTICRGKNNIGFEGEVYKQTGMGKIDE